MDQVPQERHGSEVFSLVRLKVATRGYMVGQTKEAQIALQFVKLCEVSCLNPGNKIFLKENF